MDFQFDPPLTACPVCRSAAIREYHRDFKNIEIDKCDRCEVQFMNPQYTDRYLADYYSRYTVDEPEWDEAEFYCHNFYLSLIERYHPDKGALLDIGSGKGHCVTVAKQRGWEPLGYEIDPDLAERMTKKLSIRIVSGTFTEMPWEPESFDVIYLHQVLEHLKDPTSYLSVIQKALKKNGVFFIALPNIRSRSSVLKFYLEKWGIRKKNIGTYYDTSHHLFYFTPKTIRRILEQYGFTILHTRSGHAARPNQSALKRWWRRTFSDRLLWKSTFLAIAKKTGEKHR